MVENRHTRSGPPPVRTLLHRGLPEPLPPRSTWPGRMMLWLPLVVVLMFTTPVTLMVLYDDEAQDHPNLLPVTLALLAGFGVIGYELLGALRRRRRRHRH